MSGPLTVSLDVSAIPRQPVGVGRFVIDLVKVLSRRGDVELALWCRRDDGPRWIEATGRSAVVNRAAPRARPIRMAWEQLRLPALVDSSGARVHHAPHYTMPQRAKTPCVVTIHDLTFFDHPEWHERTKVPVFRRAIRVASRHAKVLLCDSKYTADRLQELCRPSGRVAVVPLGVDLERFKPAQSVESGEDRSQIAALGVHQPYVLFLGTLEPRKAVPELVGAFDMVAGRHQGLTLVLAGRPGWGAAQVQRAVSQARNGDRIERIGYVPDRAVPALLRMAGAVAYPAKEEGFGLPALEALACGATLVTTSGTVMAELADGAAITAASGSIPELAEALDAALRGDSVDTRRALGLQIAARYSWESCADAHMDAYRLAAEDAGDLEAGESPGFL